MVWVEIPVPTEQPDYNLATDRDGQEQTSTAPDHGFPALPGNPVPPSCWCWQVTVLSLETHGLSWAAGPWALLEGLRP